MRYLLRAAVVAALAIAAPVGMSHASAQDGAPTVTVDLTGAKAGDTILVRGTGWAGTELVYVELCGNGGRDGSRSCDQGQATLAGISPDGGFAATMVVANPPVPCPCVVKATSQTTQAFAIAALRIQDVPEVPLEDQPTLSLIKRSVQVTQAKLLGRGPWTSWLGAGAHRTLRVTVANDGDVPVHDPPVAITYGKGANPSGIVPAPGLGTIEPGESVTIEVPIRYGSLSFGQHTAKVTITGFAQPVQATTTTSTYPWALVVVGLVALQLGLIYLRNRVRDRIAPPEVDDAEAEAHEADERELVPVGATAELIDLRQDAVPPHWGPVVEDEPVQVQVPPASESEEAHGTTEADEAALDVEATPTQQEPSGAEDLPHPAAPVGAQDAAPRAGDDVLDLDEPAVPAPEPAAPDLDLREAAAPEAAPEAGPELTEESAAPPANGLTAHLPNPFEQVSGEQVNGALAMAMRRDRQLESLRRDVEEQRRDAERALESAQALAGEILASAAVRVEALVDEAASARAEAVDELDQCRRDVEELLTLARATAQAIRRDAELQREATLRAAAAAQEEIDQLVAEARRMVDAQLSEAEAKAAALVTDARHAVTRDDPAQDAPAPWPTAAAGRTGTHLDSAIERAVHRALQA